MSQPPYLIGLDISATATRALLLDAASQVLAVTSRACTYSPPRPLWAEQDPAVPRSALPTEAMNIECDDNG